MASVDLTACVSKKANTEPRATHCAGFDAKSKVSARLTREYIQYTPTPPRVGAALMQMTVTGKAPLRMIDYSTAMQFCQE
jgi:hypothetical protein